MPNKGYHWDDVATGLAETAITGALFVKLGTVEQGFVNCDAQGERAHGVAPYDIAINERGPIVQKGVVDVTAGAVIALHAKVTPTAAGKAETAASGDAVCGIALVAAGADGDIIQIELLDGLTLVP